MITLNEFCKNIIDSQSRFPVGEKLSETEKRIIMSLKQKNFGDLSSKELSALKSSENGAVQALLREFGDEFNKARNDKLSGMGFDGP